MSILIRTTNHTSSAVAAHAQVKHQATRRLEEAGYLALRGLDCSVEEGRLHLRGLLPSYYLKQVALAVVGQVEGVGTVIDQIRIHSQDSVAHLVDRVGPAPGPTAVGIPPLAGQV